MSDRVTVFVLVTVPVSYTRHVPVLVTMTVLVPTIPFASFSVLGTVSVFVYVPVTMLVFCARVCDRSRQIGTPSLKTETSERLWSTIVCQL